MQVINKTYLKPHTHTLTHKLTGKANENCEKPFKFSCNKFHFVRIRMQRLIESALHLFK